MSYDLKVELPIADLEKKLNDLRCKGDLLDLEDRRQMQELEAEFQRHQEGFCHSLNGSDMVQLQLARHRDRPYIADYIKLMCDDYFELRGDRRYGDDRAILGGLATFAGQTITLIGHQKGSYTTERQERNFGMPHPEGYRKAQRLMRQAEKFGFPVVCLIDTVGAYPDVDSEKRGQARAIAESLAVMATLRVLIVAIIIGEGGGGGVMAFCLADRVLMLEHAIWTGASPEAATSMTWRNDTFAARTTDSLQLTSLDLMELGVINGIIREPPGGAHCDHRAAADLLAEQLQMTLTELKAIPVGELLQQRYAKFRHAERWRNADLISS